MKHRVRYMFETTVEAKSKREAKRIAKQMLRDGRIGEPKCSCVSLCPNGKPCPSGFCDEECECNDCGVCTLNDSED